MQKPNSLIDDQAEGPNTPTVILTTSEAARYLGLAMSTLNKWRCHGGGPVFVKLGRAVRYRHEDLDTYISTRSLSSTSQSFGRSA